MSDAFRGFKPTLQILEKNTDILFYQHFVSYLLLCFYGTLIWYLFVPRNVDFYLNCSKICLAVGLVGYVTSFPNDLKRKEGTSVEINRWDK